MADKREGKNIGGESLDMESERSSPPPGSLPSVSLQTTPEDPDLPGSEGGSSRGSSERGTPVKYRRGSRLSDSFQDNASTCSSTSSVSGSSGKVTSNSKLPVRPGISWRKGERVEAMDYLNKWYPAKIVEISEEEQLVMIHFDGWNSRYDEWVPMTSEKLRPRIRYSSRKEKPKHGVFKLGEPVYAKWTDCKMYPGKITSMPSEGAYEVLFYDGFKKVVQSINIKPMPTEVRNQKIEIVHVLPKDEKKRSGDTEVTGKRRSSSVYARRSIDEIECGDKEISETIEKVKVVQKRKSSGSRERKKKDGSKSATQSAVSSTESLITNLTESPGDQEVDDDIPTSGTEPATTVTSSDQVVKQTLDYDEEGVSFSVQADVLEQKQEIQEESKLIPEASSEKISDMATFSVKTDVSTITPASPASTLSATTTPPLTPKQSPGQKVETNVQIASNIPVTVIPALSDKITPVSRPYKKGKKEVISPSVSESSIISHIESADSVNRKRSKSSFEKRDSPVAQSDVNLSRKRSRSATTERSKGIGNYILVPETEPPPKAFVVEQEHNHYKCTFEGCNKGFRKESLLDYHLKYYHSNDGKPVQIPPPRKRRKTSSICSTDSDAPVSIKHRSRSLSGNQSKQRHISTESASSIMDVHPPAVEPPPSVSVIPVADDSMNEESNHQRSISQNTMVTEEVMETDAEDTLSKDEVVNCICGFYEENGLMIQCDVCLCWQHAACFEITEATLPKKYVCYVCDNPPGVRDSFKYIHEQDWLRNGQMAHFKFLPNQEVDESRCRTVQATHGLVSDVLNMGGVLNSLKQKYKITREKDKTNPELRNWIQNLDLVEPDDEDEDEEDDSATEEDIRSHHEEDVEAEMELSVTDNSTSEIENEAAGKLSSVTESKDTSETEGNSITGEEKNMTAETKEINSHNGQNIPMSGGKTEESPSVAKDSESVNNITAAGACLSNDSGEYKVEESSNCMTVPDGSEENKKEDSSIREDDNSDTLSADSIRYESETGGDDSQGTYPVIGPSGDGHWEGQDRRGRATDNVPVVMDNPFKNCERNLLEHILRIQNELEKRMDMIEEQVSALETADSTYQAPSQSQNILSDIPQLKRSLYMLQNDLEKVKLMSAYHR